MKILNILFESVRCPQGGMGVFVRDSMSEVAKKHEVTILGFDPIDFKFFNGEYNGCHVIDCRGTNIQIKPRGPFHFLALNDMLTENLLYHLSGEKFDVIHLHDTLCWPIAKYAAIMSRAPIVTHCHLSHALCHIGYPMDQQRIYEVTQEAHAYMMSHGILTCSKHYAARLEDYFMLDRKFTIAENGVDFESIMDYAYDPKLNHELGGGKPVVGFVGRMVPTKGVHLVLDAIEKCPDVFFVLVSAITPSVEEYMPLIKEINKMKKENKIKNFKWISGMPTNDFMKWKIMASCDFALVPSVHEPWGIVTDEWGALRVPKIVTKVDGLVEHNSDENSIMIEPTVDAVIDAVNNFVSDGQRIDMAYKSAINQSWSNTAEVICNVYAKTIEAN